MQPSDDDYQDVFMTCCGASISPHLERRSAEVHAVWECHECGAKARLDVGTVDLRRYATFLTYENVTRESDIPDGF